MTQIYVGVDISKGWIDVSHPSGGDARLLPADYAGFAERLAAEGAIAVFEATGRHDRALRAALADAGAAAVRLSPQAPRDLARVLGIRAKSDRADAVLLRRYGETFHPQPGAAPEPRPTCANWWCAAASWSGCGRPNRSAGPSRCPTSCVSRWRPWSGGWRRRSPASMP
ncbi:hypothetical protein ACFSZS_10115 [Seohaeicola zhoushanensis]